VRTLLELGRYAEAERVARRLVDAGSPELLNVLGESLAAVGKLDAADALFSRAIAAPVPDALVARANRGLLRERRGDGSGSEADFKAVIAAYNARSGFRPRSSRPSESPVDSSARAIRSCSRTRCALSTKRPTRIQATPRRAWHAALSTSRNTIRRPRAKR
jgi:hypothetical protein